MANCHSLFKSFNGEGYLKIPGSKIDKLEASSENVRKTIKEHFEKEYPRYPPKFYMQGSYKMGTTIRTKDDTCDLDDGVYFKSNPDNVTSTTLQKWIKEAVDNITDSTPSHRKKCITIDFKAGYNIDLPAFLFDKDKESHPQLAVKDDGFYLDDPKEFYDYFNNNSSDQLVRIIRFLKAWCDFKREKMASGLAVTILALYNFQKHDRDDVSLKYTLIEIENDLKLNFKCVMPTTPKDDIFKDYDTARQENFLNNLSAFITDAKSAVETEKNQLKASKLWKKHLGDRFPEGEDKDEDEVRSACLSGIIGNQKPFCGFE
ncbi:MAG: CBASS cGAMP synthase [Ferruginibacter sp.]